MKSLLPHASPRNLRLFALLGVLIAIMQLSDQLEGTTTAQAIGFWSGRIGAVVFGFIAAEAIVARLLAGRWATPPWLKPVIVTTLIAVLPITVIELGLESVVPQLPEYDDGPLQGWALPLVFLAEYATIASVVLPIHFALWLLIDHRQAADASPESAADAAQPKFLEKTQAIEAQDVVALEAEEHYVRVHTAERSELIHHRLSDAVAEMPDDLGTRVHRSWWVADRAVIGARRGSRRWQLQLSSDIHVPVSDSFVQAARARGYLRRKRPLRADEPAPG